MIARTWLALVLVSFGVLQVAPARVKAADAPDKSRIFTFRMTSEPETLDWNKAHTAIETYLLMNLMEGLMTFDPKFKVTPALAASYSLSKDQKTYTFKLKPGVKWSDGIPLKAQDFVYSWKRLISPVTGASYAYLLFDVEGAEDFYKGKLTDFEKVGIKARDDLTLEVKLLRPIANWIYIPTFWVTFPLRQDVAEKYGSLSSSVWATPGRMVTLGPYKLVSHDIDSKIVMEANAGYYGEAGNIAQIVAQLVRDDSTALTLYETGKLDMLVDLSTIDLKRLGGRQDLKSFPYFKVGYMGLVTNKYPFTNPKIRRAIAMAIDKSKISAILHGGQVGASSFVPTPMAGYSKNVGLPYNPEKAKKELKEAGIDASKPLSITITMPNSDKMLILGQYLQAQLKTVLGMDVTLEPFDHKTFRAQLNIFAYPSFINSWSADFPDPDNFLSVFLSDSGNNKTTWKNPEFDQLVLSARTTSDAKLREKKYFEAQKKLLDDQAVVIPLYYEPNLALVKSRVQGLQINPLNYLILKRVNLGP